VKKEKITKKRVLPTAKRDGILPILPMLDRALGSSIGGTASVAKEVSGSKATRRQLEELLRHNRAMEGHRLYFVPYKHGKGLYLGRVQMWTGCNNKKTQKNIKNACERNNEYAIGSTAKMHACIIF